MLSNIKIYKAWAGANHIGEFIVFLIVSLLFFTVIAVKVPTGEEILHKGQIERLGVWPGSEYEWPVLLAAVKLESGILVQVAIPRTNGASKGEEVAIAEKKYFLKGSSYEYAD